MKIHILYMYTVSKIKLGLTLQIYCMSTLSCLPLGLLVCVLYLFTCKILKIKKLTKNTVNFLALSWHEMKLQNQWSMLYSMQQTGVKGTLGGGIPLLWKYFWSPYLCNHLFHDQGVWDCSSFFQVVNLIKVANSSTCFSTTQQIKEWINRVWRILQSRRISLCSRRGGFSCHEKKQ